MSLFFRQLLKRIRRGLGIEVIASGRTAFAAARRPRPSGRLTPSVEPLGDRIVPTLTTAFDAATGALTITSDAAADVATVTTSAGGAILLNGVATGATTANATSITVLMNGGNDTADLSGLTGYGGPVTIDGGFDNDTLIGSPGDDLILGGVGNDTLIGGAGNDDLDGGLFIDSLDGGAGNDTLRDSSGLDFFEGGNGIDTLVGTDNKNNTFNVTGTNSGDLNGESFAGVERLKGGNGDDTFEFFGAGQISGWVRGGDGQDTLSYETWIGGVTVNLTTGYATSVGGLVSQVENLQGGVGNDYLQGDAADNVLDGGAGDDALVGGDGNDTLLDGPGTDIFFGGGGTDVLVAEDTDNLWFVTGTNEGNLNAQSFYGVESLTGGSDSDEFYFYEAGQIDGMLVGGAGGDTLSYWHRFNTGVTVDLGAESATSIGGGAAGHVSQIEIVVGSQVNDVLTGNSGDNVLVGMGGDDTLTGGAGRDILIGGLGTDTLAGDGGQDILIAGWTSWDYNFVALNEIRSIWRDSATTYDDRVNTLRGGWLDSSDVYDDMTADTMTGGAALDWFWGYSLDTITDLVVFDEELN